MPDASRTPSACTTIQELLSARADGELHEPLSSAVHDHLRVCLRCQHFEASLSSLQARVRGAAGEQVVPDHAAAVLMELHEQQRRSSLRRTNELRLLATLAGCVHVIVAMTQLVAAAGPAAHTGRELAVLELALGVGFLVAAYQPQRAAGVLPIAAVVAVAILGVAVIDVAAGTVSWAAELAHLTELVGVVALWALARRQPDAPRLSFQPHPA